MYKRYRFPPEITQYAVWLYFRYNPGLRDIEDLLAQRRYGKYVEEHLIL
jgi:putative transposase